MGLVGKDCNADLSFLQFLQKLPDSFIGPYMVHTVLLKQPGVFLKHFLKMDKAGIAGFIQGTAHQNGGSVSHKIFIIRLFEFRQPEFS